MSGTSTNCAIVSFGRRRLTSLDRLSALFSSPAIARAKAALVSTSGELESFRASLAQVTARVRFPTSASKSACWANISGTDSFRFKRMAASLAR